LKASTAAVHDVASIARGHCISQDGTSDLKTCAFGDPAAGTTLVLFGDSHAIPWFEPLHHMAELRGWKLVTMLKSGCSAAEFSTDPDPVLDAQCSRWRAQAIRSIIALRPSLVFLGSATNKLRRAANGAQHAAPVELEAIRQGSRHTLEALTSAGLHVLFVRDNPEFGFDMPTCLARSERHAWYARGACEMPAAAVLDPAVFDAEKSAVRGLPNVSYIDLTDQFCQNGVCGGVRNGLVIYRDSDHLTGRFAASLAPVLEPHVMAALRMSTLQAGALR
jgi:hypothetical protein